MRYTEGEWKFIVTDEGELMIDIPEGHSVYLGDMEGSCAECFGNGRLMAASKDLYIALKQYIDKYGWTPTARNAITKAEEE